MKPGCVFGKTMIEFGYFIYEVMTLKYLKQLFVILLFSLVGEILNKLIPLPIPAAIYGIVLLLIALATGALKTAAIEDTARFFLRIMPLLFVAPAANILQHWGLIAPHLVPICVITVISTVVVFIVSGWVTQLFTGKGGDKHA